MKQFLLLLLYAFACNSQDFTTQVKEQACFEFAAQPGQSYNIQYEAYSRNYYRRGKDQGPVKLQVKNSNKKILLTSSKIRAQHSVPADTDISICFSSVIRKKVDVHFDVYLDHHKHVKSIADSSEVKDLEYKIKKAKYNMMQVARKEQFRANQQTQYASMILQSEDKIKFWSAIRIVVLFIVIGIQAMIFRSLTKGDTKFQI